ncbi:hypothetical protein CP03DC29_0779B, partial [Chlamydia psittaci 03DC29]
EESSPSTASKRAC